MPVAGVLIRAAVVTVDMVPSWCTFWRHFAVLTINLAQGQNWDHLFLVREGTAKWKSWKFKVMLLRPVFETGSMAGLMTDFRRHSGLMTNFSIFRAESRPYWPGGAY